MKQIYSLRHNHQIRAVMIVVMVITLLVTTSPISAQTKELTDEQLAVALRPIVKIITYISDGSGRLVQSSQGSGVVISADGIVLTNHHVAIFEQEYDGKYRDAAYQICLLTKTIKDEPDCIAVAALVATDKDLDLALLKIIPIPDTGLAAPYQSFVIAPAESTKLNDTLYAFGYPSIGGGNLTASKGVLTGKKMDGEKLWLKLDNTSSYGSSGGAVLNDQDQIVGITAGLSSDETTSLSNVLSAVTILPWINVHLLDLPKASLLDKRLIPLTTKQRELKMKNSNIFKAVEPVVEITKPGTWEFLLKDEESLSIEDKEDPDGGSVSVLQSAMPGNFTLERIVPLLKYSWISSGKLQVTEILDQKPMTFGAQRGYRFKISQLGDISQFIIVAGGSYYIGVDYGYGKNEKDREVVEKIIASIKYGPDKGTARGLAEYRNTNPVFRLKFPKNWIAKKNNNPLKPLTIQYASSPDVIPSIDMQKLDSNQRDLSNEARLKVFLQKLKQLKEALGIVDMEVKILKTQAKYSLNKEVSDVLLTEFVFLRKSDKKTMVYNKNYEVYRGDKKMSFTLSVMSDNKKTQKQAIKDFESLMKTLSLK